MADVLLGKCGFNGDGCTLIETTLKNTSLFTDRSVGSRLRALTWDIREVPANIALLLQDPVAFPCLKEMSLRFAWRMFNAAPKSNMRVRGSVRSAARELIACRYSSIRGSRN